jgi:phytanoyl-CoA hydroxylase
MRLTRPQIDRFQSEGYTIVPNLFQDEEILAMQAEVDRFQREGLLRNVTTAGDGKTASTSAANLQLCPMWHKSTLFRALPFEPKVIMAVQALIGDAIMLHLDQIFVKPAKQGHGTAWHQDNAYFKISDPTMGVAMWVAVHDATVANGTLHVIPGAFEQLLEHSRDPDSDHHIRCYPDESRAVACEVKAGGAVFFCYGLPHCTKANNSDELRAGAAFHFLRTDFASAELLKADRGCRPILTGGGASGGIKEYGPRVWGTWRAEVDKTLGTTV